MDLYLWWRTKVSRRIQMRQILFIFAFSALCSAQVANQLVTKSANGHYLYNSVTSQPVFLTGDAPQLMATMLNTSDINTYLADRKSRGINAIWVIAADNVYSTSPPHNVNGDVPFDTSDFVGFDTAYWAYVDAMVNRASQYGLTVFLMPAFVGLNSSSGYFTDFNNAGLSSTFTSYGTFLGNRYKNSNNIVYALGGDFDPSFTNIASNISTLATAIAAADTNHLITVEICRICSPANQNSITGVGTPSWLGLNWVYNPQASVVAGCQAGFAASTTILPLMGEDWYELEHSMTTFQVRQEGWWEVLSGCFTGRLFGNSAIYGFNSVNGGGVTSPSWQSQLNSGGSVGQQYLGQLMRSREHWLMAPDTTNAVLTAGFGSGSTLSVAARSSDGQTIIAYLSDGNATAKTIDMSKITSGSSQAKCWWYNPQTSATQFIGTFANSGTRNFTAPDSNDWVLVIDDASATLAYPGFSTPNASLMH